MMRRIGRATSSPAPAADLLQRRDRVERAIALWPNARIERALATLDQAMLDSRLRGAITDEVLGQALMMISTLAARRAQTPAG